MLVVVIAASLTFFLLHAAPGDPYSNIDTGVNASPAVVALQRAQRGLDLPLGQQYLRWLANYARGEFGWSTSQQRPVLDVLAAALPRSLALMALAMLASFGLGVAAGTWQGSRIGSRADRVASFVWLAANSFPAFWIAILLMLLLTPWPFPVSGLTSDEARYFSWPAQLRDRALHLALPLGSLAIVGVAVVARYQRAAMRSAFAQPFVQTARAKGLDERGVRRHAMRNALLPVVTLFGLDIPTLIAGAVFVETVFAWPGMGTAMLAGLNARDYDLVSAGIVIVAGMTVVGSLVADLLRELVDPRTRAAA